ncbi:MAG: peptidoglycan-binding domain-containing protein, partial [Methylococcales bacterium]
MTNTTLTVGALGGDVVRLHSLLQAQGLQPSEQEIKQASFGPDTRRVVAQFQQQNGLQPTGVVDPQTAAAIGLVIPDGSPGIVGIEPINPLSQKSPVPSPIQQTPTVSPLPVGSRSVNLIIPPLRRNGQGADIVNLQEALLLLIDRQIVPLSAEDSKFYSDGLKSEQQKQIYNDYTEKLIGVFQQQFSTKFQLTVNGLVDTPTADATEQTEESFTVDGKVMSAARAGVDGLRVVIVDKNTGINSDVYLAETVTGNGGSYLLTFVIRRLQDRCKLRPDLQSRVFLGETFLDASNVRYNASNRETLNVLLTEKSSSALASEYETLISALTNRCRANLKDLKENDEQQDITYLANKTGWDARSVALAALADQFSDRTTDANGGSKIDPAFFYALFRAGLPANDDALYQTDATTAESIWKQAISQGVIANALESSLAQARDRFQSLAAERALKTPALSGVSSLKEMLSVSLGEDSVRQQQFAALYTEFGSEPDTLWTKVRENFGDTVDKRLRIDGQLS